jgi:hypothetical protein
MSNVTSPQTQSKRLKVIDFRRVTKNTLRGFATVEMPEGLEIKDVSVHESNGKRFALLPSKAWVEPDGTVKRNNEGRIIWLPVLSFKNDRLRHAFSDRVVEGVLAILPSAFGD